MTGGELAAIPIIDSTARLIEGVLRNEVTSNESHSNKDYKFEYPQYTRPEKFGEQSVPDVLLSGNHQKIEEWKKEKTKK